MISEMLIADRNGGSAGPNRIVRGCPRCQADLLYDPSDAVYRCVNDACAYEQSGLHPDPKALVVVEGTRPKMLTLGDVTQRWGISESGAIQRLKKWASLPHIGRGYPIPESVIVDVETKIKERDEPWQAERERNRLANVAALRHEPNVPERALVETASQGAVPVTTTSFPPSAPTRSPQLRIQLLRLALETIARMGPTTPITTAQAVIRYALEADALEATEQHDGK